MVKIRMRNECTLTAKLKELEGYRLPLAVSEIRLFRNGDAFPVCPRCRVTLNREYQSYCDRCGQRLDWGSFHRALVIMKK